jgi:hypothetical protein
MMHEEAALAQASPEEKANLIEQHKAVISQLIELRGPEPVRALSKTHFLTVFFLPFAKYRGTLSTLPSCG